MENRKKQKLISLFLLLFLLFGVNFVFALEIDYPRLPGTEPPQDFLKTAPAEEIPSLYVKYLFNLVIWLVGIIAFGALIYGGIKYLISTGKAEAMASAREQISAVFFGVLILLSSFFILKTLNPQLTILKLPGLKAIPKPPAITKPPPVEKLRTSTNTEIPLGTIIQKGVFEGTIPWEKGKRIPRIKEIAENTFKISQKLEQQNTELKEITLGGITPKGIILQGCTCQGIHLIDPKVICPSLCILHPPPRSCFCDPCIIPRLEIERIKNQNITEINNLQKEQEKAYHEIRLLKEQIAKLERAEKFILDCYEWLDSLAAFLVKKDSFIATKDILRKINFWDEIAIKEDAATFYCPVSGTILGETEYIDVPSSPEEEINTEEIDTGPVEEYSPACMPEVPVGEIIDRTKRVGDKLVERMEKLINLDQELIDAVNKMHHLVSQCTSQDSPPSLVFPPRCVSVCDPLFCIPVRCVGPIPEAIDMDALKKMISDVHIYLAGGQGYPGFTTSPPGKCWYRHHHKWKFDKNCYKREFPKEFNDRMDEYMEKVKNKAPCPYNSQQGRYEIAIQLDRIIDIIEKKKEVEQRMEKIGEKRTKERIEDVVKAPKQKGELIKIGITTIIDKIVPKILEDLDEKIRNEMKYCVTDFDPYNPEIPEIVNTLMTCGDSQRSVGPEAPGGKIIQKCCLEEKPFQDCLAKCYLEEGYKKYKECLYKCIETLPEGLNVCRHKLNFYCCE